MAGVVQVQGCDLCSKSGDRLVGDIRFFYAFHDSLPLMFVDIVINRLALGKSVTLRRVVPILGVPDALVPIDLPTSQVSLFPGYSPH